MTMYRQNSFYRVKGPTNAQAYEKEMFVPEKNIIQQSDQEAWTGYLDPFFWKEI